MNFDFRQIDSESGKDFWNFMLLQLRNRVYPAEGVVCFFLLSVAKKAVLLWFLLDPCFFWKFLVMMSVPGDINRVFGRCGACDETTDTAQLMALPISEYSLFQWPCLKNTLFLLCWCLCCSVFCSSDPLLIRNDYGGGVFYVFICGCVCVGWSTVWIYHVVTVYIAHFRQWGSWFPAAAL